MRTHYGPWQPCWISNQHQKHKSGRGPSSEHFWQVWLISVQRFQRRRFKCEKLTDGWTDAYPWQKLTWPMARWAKNEVSIMKLNAKRGLEGRILHHLSQSFWGTWAAPGRKGPSSAQRTARLSASICLLLFNFLLLLQNLLTSLINDKKRKNRGNQFI